MALGRDELGAELQPIAGDLEEIEEIIFNASGGEIPFLTEISTYLTKAGGKRIRAALMLFSSMLGSGPSDDVRKTAAAVEMTHLATLYHDDVIDEADLRRGVPSANEKWDNTAAILAGDYLFSRASALAAQVGGAVPEMLANVIAKVIQGQVRELEMIYDPSRSMEHYFDTVAEKTAALFEACGHLGASLAGCEPEVVDAASRYSASFGVAFQIADDLLDLAADREELGKSPGTDVRDGVYTLPLILAAASEPQMGAELRKRNHAQLDKVQQLVTSTGAYQRAVDIATEHAHEAVSALQEVPDGPARHSLEAVGWIVVRRVPKL
jgi:geranylgeranyl pyrophosphate synthase